jgi:hypothetical protein
MKFKDILSILKKIGFGLLGIIGILIFGKVYKQKNKVEESAEKIKESSDKAMENVNDIKENLEKMEGVINEAQINKDNIVEKSKNDRVEMAGKAGFKKAVN